MGISKKITILIFVLLINVPAINSQNTVYFFDKTETQILENLYQYNFITADSLILKLSKQKKNSQNITNINYYWWHIISGNDSVYFSKKAIKAADDGIAILDLKEESQLTNDDIYSLIIFYAFKARFEILSNNYFKALKFLQKSIRYIEISANNINEYENFKLTTGLYLYTISHMAEKYPIFYPYIMFLPKGNKELGLKYLKDCLTSKDIVVRTEARYFLMKIYLESENKYDIAELHLKYLLKNYPNNLVFHYYFYQSLILQKKIDESKLQLNNMEKNANNNSELNNKQKTHFIDIINEKLND